MKTLADRLQWARERKGLSRTQVAADSGVTTAAISHLETGIRKSARNIVQIARALGVDPEWLSEGKGSPDPTHVVESQTVASVQLVYVTQVELALLTAYRESDASGRDFIEKAARIGAGNSSSAIAKVNGTR